MSSPSLFKRVVHKRHLGVYSAERHHALQHYQQHTSRKRAIGVCLLTPLPVLVYLIAIEAAIPLAPIEDGLRGNPGIVIRFFVVTTSTAFTVMELMRCHMPTLQVTPRQFILPAIATSLLHTSFMLSLSLLWVFPVPFSATLTAGVFTTFCGISIVIFIGVKPFQAVPSFRRKLMLYIAQLSLLNFLIVAYPAYGAFYRTLRTAMQPVSIALPMLLKLLAKKVTTALIRELDGDDFVPVVTQFSVELLHSLSITTCVQTTTTPLQVVILIIIFDFLPLIRAYIAIHTLLRGSARSHSTIHIFPIPASRRLVANGPAVSGLRRSRASKKMCRALYESESHMLMEYIESVTPALYATYAAVLYVLPNARFYDAMQSMQTTESLHRFLANVCVLVSLQTASLVLFTVVLSRKVLPTVSTLHQLSFVLETQRDFVQCWLFAWIPFCILTTSRHSGMDFTLRFEWLHKAT